MVARLAGQGRRRISTCRISLTDRNRSPAHLGGGMSKADITTELVSGLVRSQFPQWADLPIRPVTIDGHDNSTFHLGSTMSVRLPSSASYAAQVGKEQRWLPMLAGRLPLPIPEPLAQGEPTPEYRQAWSVYRWLDGETVSLDRVADLERLAGDVAAFPDGALQHRSDRWPAAGHAQLLPRRPRRDLRR